MYSDSSFPLDFICIEYLFPALHLLSVCFPLHLNLVFQVAYRWVLFILSTQQTFFFTEEVNAFIFNYWEIHAYFYFDNYFLFVFVVPLCSFLFIALSLSGLMTLLVVCLYSCLSIFRVCTINFCFVVPMRLRYNNSDL